MALNLNRLIRNLANIKHEHTNQNKFLKTKAKIKEMKNNVKEAQKDAIAIHDYVEKAEVSFGGGGSGTPIIHPNSFKFMPRRLLNILTLPAGSDASNAAITELENDLTLGLMQTTTGRYLTTKGASNSIAGTFRAINSKVLSGLMNAKGKLK
jgi:hypothetical protein